MDYKIKTAKSFDKEIKRLSKRYVSIAGDYAKLLLDISANPHLALAADCARSVWLSLRKGKARAAAHGLFLLP